MCRCSVFNQCFRIVVFMGKVFVILIYTHNTHNVQYYFCLPHCTFAFSCIYFGMCITKRGPIAVPAHKHSIAHGMGRAQLIMISSSAQVWWSPSLFLAHMWWMICDVPCVCVCVAFTHAAIHTTRDTIIQSAVHALTHANDTRGTR